MNVKQKAEKMTTALNAEFHNLAKEENPSIVAMKGINEYLSNATDESLARFYDLLTTKA